MQDYGFLSCRNELLSLAIVLTYDSTKNCGIRINITRATRICPHTQLTLVLLDHPPTHRHPINFPTVPDHVLTLATPPITSKVADHPPTQINFHTSDPSSHTHLINFNITDPPTHMSMHYVC